MSAERLIKCESPFCEESESPSEACALCQIHQPVCRAEPGCSAFATVCALARANEIAGGSELVSN